MARNRPVDREIAIKAVAAALGDVAAKDQLLLTLQAHELTLVHRFGVYLEIRLQPALME